MKPKLSIYWSRRDFRIRDNAALYQAIKQAQTDDALFLPMFVVERYMTAGNPKYQFGYPSRYFLMRAIPAFAEKFKTFGCVHGTVVKQFVHIAKKYDVTIHVNEDVYPDFYTQLNKIKDSGITIKMYRDQLGVDKETRTGTGNLYSVFTPFKKAVWNLYVNEKEVATPHVDSVNYADPADVLVRAITPDFKTLEPLFSKKESIIVAGHEIDISEMGLPKREIVLAYESEDEALHHFKQYLATELSDYKDKRDSLELNITSRMSVALTWGLVSSRTLVRKIQKHFDDRFDNVFSLSSNQGALHYISELIWREFYKYLAFHNPALYTTEFQERFRTIEWLPQKQAMERFVAWIQGKTGYPVVDAAMMELARSGLVHNRSRMIVASILTKNLGVDWRWGQEYFRAMLLDLDESSNNGGWQWGASVGADPKPIRIFNPYLQAENYDKAGVYQRTWLSAEYLENPPQPIIEHKAARGEALKRYGLSHDVAARDF